MSTSAPVRGTLVLLLPLLWGCSSDRETASPQPATTTAPAYQATVERPASPSTLRSEPSGDITLRDVLALALVQSPELSAVAWEARAWEARRLQAGALPNPTLAIGVENIAGSDEFRGTDRAEYTLSIAQLIELGGKRSARIRQAGFGSAAANWDQESQRLLVLSLVADRFIALVGAQQHVDLATQALATATKAVEAADERVRVGKATPVEGARARLMLTDARLGLARTNRDLKTLRSQVAASWGSASPKFTAAVAKLDDVQPLPSAENLRGRLAQHPDLRRLDAEIEGLRAVTAGERAKAIPDVELGAGYRRFNEDGQHAFVFSASVPLPVFDRNRGGIEEAEHRQSKARAERAAAELKLTTEFDTAYLTLTTSFEEASSLLSDDLPSSERIFADVEAGYRAGKFTFLDLLEAQRSFAAMKGRYIDALVQYRQSVNALERLTGGPVVATDPSTPTSTTPVPATTGSAPALQEPKP